ncbi:hypothetical protein ACM6TU_004419, partial [Escherichia coli]
ASFFRYIPCRSKRQTTLTQIEDVTLIIKIRKKNVHALDFAGVFLCFLSPSIRYLLLRKSRFLLVASLYP